MRHEFAERYSTMHFVGRNGMQKYNNQGHAMLTARNILEDKRKYNIWNVNEDAECHEAGTADAQEALNSVRLVPVNRAES